MHTTELFSCPDYVQSTRTCGYVRCDVTQTIGDHATPATARAAHEYISMSSVRAPGSEAMDA